MRKQMITVLCVGMMVLFAAGPAFAGEAGKWGMGLRLGYSGYAGDTITDSGVDVDFDPDGAAFYGANLTYFFSNDWALEGALEYCTTSVDAKAAGWTDDIGDLTQIPLLLTLRYQPTVGAWMPYVGAGVGYYFNSFDSSDPADDSDFEDSFGFLLNVGADYMVNANNCLGLDLRYTFNSAEVEDEPNSPDFELNAFQAGLTWKYMF